MNLAMVSPKGSQFPPLATQGSVYNLSFDDVQSQLGNIGKPFNSTNLNELVKNVVSVDEGNHHPHHHLLSQNPSSSSSSSSPPASYLLGNFNLNGKLSKKTIDEVNDNSNNKGVMQLGETTLEDFLFRAGVINNHHQQPPMAIDPMVVMSPQQADWMQFQLHQQQQQQQQMSVMDANFNVSESGYENPSVVDMGYSENHHQMAMSMTMPVAAIPATPSDSKTAGEKKREEMMEKSIERRQKRMIKNRESAARSRARKQAYTNQLELEVFRLRKKNSWLRRQMDVDMLLSSNPASMPKYQLRRTSSF